MRRVICVFLYFCIFSERAARGGEGGGAARLFLFSFFPCSADHERDWPPCKVVFLGLATNALNVRNNNDFFFQQQQQHIHTYIRMYAFDQRFS